MFDHIFENILINQIIIIIIIIIHAINNIRVMMEKMNSDSIILLLALIFVLQWFLILYLRLSMMKVKRKEIPR